MKIRIYHELNDIVEVEIDAVLQHQAGRKESKSESKEKDDSCNLQKFLQVYAPDMPYITAKKTASKMKISVEDADEIIAKCKEKGLLEKVYIARCPKCGSLIKMDKDRLKLFSIKDCYVCGKNITLENEDIILAYSLSEKIM
jgi:ribosomal protein S25